jgi:hypothetical protein
MQILFTHTIDINQLAIGFGLDTNKSSNFLNDGRLTGRLAEFIFAQKTGGNKTAENMPYDIDMPNGDRVEIRSVTKGLSFASSKEVGFGRKVTAQGFLDKLNSVDYFVAVDYDSLMGTMKFIKVEKSDIITMESKQLLRKNKSISRKKFMGLVHG